MEFHQPAINPFQLYTLAEARELVGIAPGDLIRLAGATLINLCVLVPAGKRAHSVDPSSVVTWDGGEHLNREVFHTKPSKEHGVPERKDDVIAVVLNWSQCQQVFDHGVSRQVFFQSAYAIEGGRSSGLPSSPVHLRPVRFPLFTADGQAPADQSKWRFAIYPNSVQFQFFEGHGYAEPDDIIITKDAVYVLGFELSRLPRTIDHSPNDVDVVVDENHHQENSNDFDEFVSPIFDTEGETVNISDNESMIEKLEPGDSCGAGSSSTGIPKNEGRPDLIQEVRGPLVLLTREEVERVIKKGRSWIYERLNKKHPRFDPTFPRPIEINSGLLWIKSEVEDWWQLQIQNGLERSRGARSK
jgi:prophage regulatory protein